MSKASMDKASVRNTDMMEHKGGMIRNFAIKGHLNDGNASPHQLRTSASPCHDSCKNGKKSTLSSTIRGLPEPFLTTRKISDRNCNLKKDGTAFELKDDAFCNSGLSPCSDASNELQECMSEESVNMESKNSSSLSKSIVISEQISSFYKDESLQKYIEMAPEEVPPDESIISFDDVPWAWSDGSSDESPAMACEPPPSTLETTASSLFSHGYSFKGPTIEFEVRPHKTMPLSGGELKSRAKESPDRFDTTTIIKPKEQKQMNGFKANKKQERESSLPVKNSLLDRVKAKNKSSHVLESSIVKEKSTILDRIVKSVKPKHTNNEPNKGPSKSLPPIIIKKKPQSPPKMIHLSPQPSLLSKTVIKSRSPTMNAEKNISSYENEKIVRNAGMLKLGGEKTLKEAKAVQSPKSTINSAPGLNSRKLALVKNQVGSGKMNGAKEKTRALDSQKLPCEAQKLSKMSPQLPLRSSSSRFSISPSILSSSYEDEVKWSKKIQFSAVKGRAPLHPVDQKLTKLRSQPLLSPATPRKSISSPAFVSLKYKEGTDGQKISVIGTQFCSQNSHYKITKETTENAIEGDNLFLLDNLPFTSDIEASADRESSGPNMLEFVPTKVVFEAMNTEGDEGMAGFTKSEESAPASSKNAQALINVVSEETAIKLVETKKNKVKALVSAFESRGSF